MSDKGSLLVVEVDVRVKAEFVEVFRTATIDNASHSAREPGIARFDFFQDRDEPTHFLLIEVYKTAAAPAAHKETAHYQRWRDAVAEMMAAPRSSRKYVNVFPGDGGF